MNYLRGAVNAISAPYQYYKELPPINPSTLTGAIDVIVVQRPADNGGTELVCSPFHVRFGKWQVLRPSEKMVEVTVNGHSIPYHMKIGEAGEAFFVFETDDDVPADLITSPIIQPEDVADHAAFEGEQPDASGISHASAQEPDFLDLDASTTDDRNTSTSTGKTKADDTQFKAKVRETPVQLDLRRPGREDASRPPYPTPDASPPHTATPSTLLQHLSKGNDIHHITNEVVDEIKGQLPTSEVENRHNLALDMEGYHSRTREPSEETIVGNDDMVAFPMTSSSSSSSSGSANTPQPSRSPSPLPPRSRPQSLTLPPFRATSEPPPDADESQLVLTPRPQQYSWEWGAFPQPSPVQPKFMLGSNKDSTGTWSIGRRKIRRSLNRTGSEDKGKARMLDDASIDEGGEVYVGETDEEENPIIRCHSVPPELDGSPTLKRKELPSDTAKYLRGPEHIASSDTLSNVYGAGGTLAPVKSDPTRLMVILEGKKTEFELSVVPADAGGLLNALKVFNGRDEVLAADTFDQGKVEYHKFLDDSTVVCDPGLVIRWSGDAYIIRNDCSPLMDALILWRDAALREKAMGVATRPVSPSSDLEPSMESDTEDEDDNNSLRMMHNRSKSLPPIETTSKTESRKPSSSSWARWWNRSKNQEKPRPELPYSVSAPTDAAVSARVDDSSSKVGPSHASFPTSPPHRKKFAKTLRLTSDQLKALNLRVGANSITFSLSASGTIACTAQIFVWDHSDFVVVSDIDGTITKSDALGHVLTMIGRDWTHSGVAKLYTDITRNGYKIMYLTSRAIGQADSTRDYLKGIKQDHYQLPDGPVIMSPDRLMASLHREVIMRKPEVFKMACLRDIRRLFGEASRNPFYAGFGNRITDALSYRSVDVPRARIFTIDSTGEVKMELLELAGYKSSYIHMTDLVDQMFPPIHRKWAPEYTDFNYWKPPMQDFPLPDLSPPSPALSARSDTSNQSALARIRNFSLVGSRRESAIRQANDARQELPTHNHNRSADLRQMTSFERLSNTISNFTRSSSPDSVGRSASPESKFSYHGSGPGAEDADYDRRRGRRQSITSMPGSLDDMHFGMDDSDEEDIEAYGHDEDGEAEEPDDEAFDEDLMLAGEMKNVPFL